MSQPPSKTHILNKSNYTIHHLVHLPSQPLAPLPPSSLRIRPRLLGLTTNNLSYARLGGLLGWFSAYPLPAHTPAPYNDPKTYARIAAWGYAEIVESNVPSIPAGKSIYGFLPITDGLESMQIEIATRDGAELPGQIVVVDEHRRGLMKVYNRYEVCAPLEELEKAVGRESLGYDALMLALFLSAFNFNRYCFAWEEGKRVHPAGEWAWGEGDADLKDAVVVVLNASGKTSLSFAYCLRNDRPAGEQPRKIVGVGSEKSVATIRQSGLYDEVVLNGEADAIKAEIESSSPKRIVLIDFGARPGVAPEWFATLSASSVPVSRIMVGGEVSVLDPEEIKRRIADRGKIVAMNASACREWAIKVDGSAHFEDVKTAFEGFKGQNKALSLVLRQGFEHWEKGWEELCKDHVKADVGLVCRL